MPPSPEHSSSISQQEDKKPMNKEELESYKYILGDFGIQMLLAIGRGAHNPDSILMLSGVPMGCIKGRLPVLMNLKLIVQIAPNEYQITKKGIEFLRCVHECI